MDKEIYTNKKLLIILSFLSLIFLIIISLGIGNINISPKDILETLINKIINRETNYTYEMIIINTRLPRILLSILVGGILALSGLVYQTLLKNPLAEPFTLGVSSSVSFGIALGIFISDFFLKTRISLFPFAFITGFIATILLFHFAMGHNVSLFTLIFFGISCQYFFNAFLTLLLSLLGDRSYEVLMWTFGTFANPPKTIYIIIFYTVSIFAFVYIFFQNKKLDLFYLSDDIVKSSGIEPNKTRKIILFIASILTITSVSICGIIGFIGLIVPHLSRLIFGNRHKFLIPATIILGASIILISDNIARSFVGMFTEYGKELPIGVVTSILGTPLFLYFLIKNKKRG